MNWFRASLKKEEPQPISSLRILILGSPNVGKTMLMDAIAGQDPSTVYTPTYGCNLKIHVENY